MLRRILFGLSESARARNFVISHPLARRASRRLVAGETLDEAMAVIDRLGESGYFAVLNHLGERITRPGEAETAAADYLDALSRLRGRPPARDCYVSVKLTQLGLDFDPDLTAAHLRRILVPSPPPRTSVPVASENSP